MEEPLVSIVTPCYNGSDYLRRYFDSILSQTYKRIQLIFVNDGSTDDTEEIVAFYTEKLERVGISIIYLEQKNAGQAAALNCGLKVATGEYLTWPDADDVMMPDCIEKKVAFLECHHEFDYCVCDVAEVDEENGCIRMIRKPMIITNRRTNFENYVYGNCIWIPGAYMARMSFVDKAIANREIYVGRGGQNVQLLLPMAWYGELGYINEVLFQYYVRSNSHSHEVQNSVRKTVEHIEQIENIFLNTISRIQDDSIREYVKKEKRIYARSKFGHALNTRDGGYIFKYFIKLLETGEVKIQDLYLVIRYTLPF